MSKDKLQDKYNEIFREIKEEKMDWDFGEFLSKVDEHKNEGKIIPLQTQESKPSIPKFFWPAAAIAVVLGMFFITKFNNSTSVVEEQDALVKNEILKQKQDELLAINEAAKPDSVIAKEKDSMVQNIVPDKEAEEVMNKILSKKGRLKKNVKQRYAVAETSPEKEKAAKATKPEKPMYQENFVIINGQKIENEKEAIDVAKYSLQMLSRQVSKTVAKAEPITDFTE